MDEIVHRVLEQILLAIDFGNRPHRWMPTRIQRLSNGMWQVTTPENGHISGQGVTPAMAYEAFDVAFNTESGQYAYLPKEKK